MPLLLTEDRGAVRHLVLNRPEKRNALSGDLIRELGAAIEESAADEEVRVVVLPDVGGCSRLPAVVGLGNAKELIMTGKVIDGREAHRIGFANRIAPAESLDELTGAFAEELLACAPRAVGLAKRVLDVAAKPALSATLELEVAAQEQLAGTEDFAEGTRAFF